MDLAAIAGPLRTVFEDLKFWLRMRISAPILAHWNKVLVGTVFLWFAGLGVFIAAFLRDWKLDQLGVVLAIFFGIFTIVSLGVSVAVLHYVRDLIPDYAQAGRAFERLLRGSRGTLYVLTENPAFLQFLDPGSLSRWIGQVRQRVEAGHLDRVVFSYIRREDLVGKLDSWARTIRLREADAREEFLNKYTFDVCREMRLKGAVRLVPLDAPSLPFYVARSGDIAMFCHTKIDDHDVRRSVIKGFVTYDEHLVAALEAVFAKFLQLTAWVYKYECKRCRSERGYEARYCFDHDLILEFKPADLESTPAMRCPLCQNDVSAQGLRLLEVDPSIRARLFEEATGLAWEGGP